jgi:hypothetical protein
VTCYTQPCKPCKVTCILHYLPQGGGESSPRGVWGICAPALPEVLTGSNTKFFIPRQSIPKGKIVTYDLFVVNIRPNKTETRQVCLTVGGNLIQYPGDASTRSADLTTSKSLWKSTISTEGAKYLCLDVKSF